MEAVLESIPGVAHVELLSGAEASEDRRPDLLVEVPHGADRRAHYDALRRRLKGELPPALEAFFHFNTDVGAWAYGRAAAVSVLEAEPTRRAVVIRSLIPRTFIDCNRPSDFAGDETVRLTAGLHEYVRHPDDRRLLGELHKDYVGLAERAYEAVCGHGGLALVPHTYGPRTLDIARIGDDIVEELRHALAPERADTWPLRPEIDLLTRDPDGRLLAPEGAEEALLDAFRQAGMNPEANVTYCLQPPTLAHSFSVRYPGRLLCLEVRRDLLVESWRPFEEMIAEPERTAGIAATLAPVLTGLLDPT